MQKRSPNILGQPLIYLGGLPEQNVCLGNTAFKFAFFSSRNKSITLQINAKVKKKQQKTQKQLPKSQCLSEKKILAPSLYLGLHQMLPVFILG